MGGCGWPAANLIATSLLMFLGSLLAGGLPFIAKITKTRAGLVSGGAAGILLGSVLGVIVPEGFHALEEGSTADGEEHTHAERPPWIAGASMLVGFVIMMFLEALSSAHGHGLGRLGENMGDPRRDKDEDHLLLGLVVHSVADGIAVGTAALAPNGCIGLLVGLAMVLHKGPVAFGLSVYLSGLQLPLQRIRRDLLLFSSASPLAAILVYSLHGILPSILGSTNIGYLLLFSAGTFMFVACTHMIPELLNSQNGFSKRQIGAVAFGSLIPLCLSSLIGHGH